MLVHHAETRRDRRARLARGQGATEQLHAPPVGGVMAEQDVHQRGLARAVLAQKRDHLTRVQLEAHRVVRGERAEPLGDPVEAEDDLRPVRRPGRLRHQDFGSLSSTSTVNVPALIASSCVATRSIASAGTLPSNVPIGASSAPPSAMNEYLP